MKYACTNCNYTFDESVGDIGEGINPGEKLCDLGDYFSCPSCNESSDNFHEIIEEVNYFGDENNLDFLEVEHFPIISFEENTLKVFVGKQEHPMGEDHRIGTISLYDEYGDLVEEKFLIPDDEPKTEFDISDFDDFEVRVSCTIHGIWGIKISSDT